MDQSKYPAFYALIALVAAAAKDTSDAVVSSSSLLSKVLEFENLVPLLMQLYPVAADIAVEAKAMSAQDIEAAAEQLVVDLEFSSDKAKAVIAAAFPLAESLAGLVPQVQALVAAIKA